MPDPLGRAGDHGGQGGSSPAHHKPRRLTASGISQGRPRTLHPVAERLTKKQRRDETQAKLAAMRAAQARRSAGPSCSPRSRPWSRCSSSSASSSSSRSTPAAARPSRPRRRTAPTAVVPGVTGVSLDTFNTVGAGTIQTPPTPMKNAEAITADGKPQGALHRCRVLPVLRRRAVADGRGAVPVRHLQRPRHHLVVRLGHRPQHRRRCPSTARRTRATSSSFTGYETTTNQQQADGSYPPLDTLSAADEALLNEVRLPAVRRRGQQGGDPVRRHRRQVADQRRELRPGAARGQDPAAGRGRDERPDDATSPRRSSARPTSSPPPCAS